MLKRIVYTRPDNGVSICAPSLTALRFMTNGGGRWNSENVPNYDGKAFLERQIAEQAKHGVGEYAAARFVNAMQYGGCTANEAYAIICDRFCAHLGTGCELWGIEEISKDRWFRDAWRRSQNGGPIYIDLRKARRIQLDKIKQAVSRVNKPRLQLGRRLFIPQWGELGNAIRHVRDEEELQRVWPKELITYKV